MMLAVGCGLACRVILAYAKRPEFNPELVFRSLEAEGFQVRRPREPTQLSHDDVPEETLQRWVPHGVWIAHVVAPPPPVAVEQCELAATLGHFSTHSGSNKSTVTTSSAQQARVPAPSAQDLSTIQLEGREGRTQKYNPATKRRRVFDEHGSQFD